MGEHIKAHSGEGSEAGCFSGAGYGCWLLLQRTGYAVGPNGDDEFDRIYTMNASDGSNKLLLAKVWN